MNTQRLEKLADFLDALPTGKFDFDSVVSEWDRSKDKPCGSVCCAIGWTPMVFPEVVKWSESFGDGLLYHQEYAYGYLNLAMLLFDISMEEADYLFTPDEGRSKWGVELIGAATAKQVADGIRRFIAWKSPVAVPELVMV